jgi:hypothetical protein
MAVQFSSDDVVIDALRGREWRSGSWRISDLHWDRPHTLDEEGTRLAHHVASQGIYTEEAGMLAACSLARVFDDRATRRMMSRQAADESKHSEVFDRYLHKRFGYPLPRVAATNNLLANLEAIGDPLRLLLAHTLLEGMALDQFRLFVERFSGDLLGEIYEFVRSDEAQHVAVGMRLCVALVGKQKPDEVEELREWCRANLFRISGLPEPGDTALMGQPESSESGMVELLNRRLQRRCGQIFCTSTGGNAL